MHQKSCKSIFHHLSFLTMPSGDTNMISDTFWLNLGAEVVYNSLDNRIAAVERLQKTIVWIFSIYSAISIGSVFFSSNESWSNIAFLLFGLAFLFMIISYWVATTATFPRVQDFYGNSVESIRDAYLASVNRSAKSFSWAIVLCSAGVLLYSVALFLQFGSPTFNKNCKEVVVKEPDSLLLHVKPVTVNTFALQIQSRKNSWVNYTLLSDTMVGLETKTKQDSFSVQSIKMKSMWLYIDTTAKTNQVMIVNILANRKYYLNVSRTDTLNSGTVFYTVRKRIKIEP